MSRQIGQRIHLVAAPEAKRGTTREEERDVGAKRRRHIDELIRAQGHTPHLRQRQHRCGRIAAAASETTLERDALVQPHEHILHRPRSPQRTPQRARRTPHQIRFVERNAGGVALDRKRPRPRDAVDRVVQGERLKNGAKLVIAVWPGAEHTKIEVDLRVGANGDRPARRHRLPIHRRTRISNSLDHSFPVTNRRSPAASKAMPLSTSSPCRAGARRPVRSSQAVTRPVPGAMMAMRSVSQTFEYTSPLMNSSSLSRSIVRSPSFTVTRLISRWVSGSRKRSVDEPSLMISRVPSWVSPQPSPRYVK